MNLLIFGSAEAAAHDPVDNTYAIRIEHPQTKDKNWSIPLKESSKYVGVDTYYFSDCWPGGVIFDDDILFDEHHAKKIIENFKNKKDITDTLLVHCSRGINRSPAVGIALNELFNLGHDTEKLKDKYPQSTWHVYRTLIKVGQTYL